MSHVPSYCSLKVHSGQAEISPARKTTAGSLGEARENEVFLSTTVLTFRIQGQAEGCLALSFFFSLSLETELLKNTPLLLPFVKSQKFWVFFCHIQLLPFCCWCLIVAIAHYLFIPQLKRNRAGLETHHQHDSLALRGEAVQGLVVQTDHLTHCGLVAWQHRSLKRVSVIRFVGSDIHSHSFLSCVLG